MPTFSQQFLANLGGAGGMLQGFSDLGGAIGGVGGQIKEKRRLVEEATELKNSGLKPGSSGYIAIQARQAAARGDRDLAIKYANAAAVARNNEETLALAKAREGREKAKAGRETTTFSQEQDDRGIEISAEEAIGSVVIEDFINAKKTGKNILGEPLTAGEKKQINQILLQVHNSKGDRNPRIAERFAEKRDSLLGKKEIVNSQIINFVTKQGVPVKSVFASDTAAIEKALEEGLVEGSRVGQPKDGFEVITNEDGGITVRMGGSGGRTVGSQTRDQGLAQQTDSLQGMLDSTRESINSLQNPERAFVIQGAVIDSSVVGTLMELPPGEVAVETLAGIIGKPISSEEAASIKAVRSQLHNLVSNARSVTKGIQSTRGASTTEKDLAAKVIRGLEAKDDLEAVLASLEVFQELLTLRKAAVGRKRERTDPLPGKTDEEIKTLLGY